MTISKLTKHEITDSIINGEDLHTIISQDADSAVIYHSDSSRIYNEANQDELDYACQQMQDTGFVFEDLQKTETTAAYWISELQLSEQYREELQEDLNLLLAALSEVDDADDDDDDELQDAIDLIEECI